jgi:hypothetical protein
VASKHCLMRLFVICICILITSVVKQQGMQHAWERQEINVQVLCTLQGRILLVGPRLRWRDSIKTHLILL